jgi:hypothetical protein
MSSSPLYNFYFKVLSSNDNEIKTFYHAVNSEFSCKQFIRDVKQHLIELRIIQEETTTIELIETGDISSELAQSISYPDNLTLKDIYELTWRTTAFYIKINI